MILFLKELTLSSFRKGVKNICSKSNPLTKYLKNKSYTYIPNLKGDCKYSRKYDFGKNYCIKCSENKNLFQKCEDDYFFEENGCSSYTENREVSENGSYFEFNSHYILIEIEDYYIGGIKVCKSLNTEDLNNFKSNYMKFASSVDKKCTNI